MVHCSLQRTVLFILVLSFLSHVAIINIHHQHHMEGESHVDAVVRYSSAQPTFMKPLRAENQTVSGGMGVVVVEGGDVHEVDHEEGKTEDLKNGDIEGGRRGGGGSGGGERADGDKWREQKGKQLGDGRRYGRDLEKRGNRGKKGSKEGSGGGGKKHRGREGGEEERDVGQMKHHGTKNPVILLLSEGRSGSTLAGSLLLEHNPYCGQYMDELVWLVFRQHLASSEDADRGVAIDMTLNSTQCALSPKLWSDAKTVGSWFEKRSQYANQDLANPQSFYSRENQWSLCSAVRKSQTDKKPKGVCLKEIRFQGYVREVLSAASERGVPLTLIYMIRDPRAVTLSQMWVFPSLRLNERDLSVQGPQLLIENCNRTVRDLEAMLNAPPGTSAVQFCFEDILTAPEASLHALYEQVPSLAADAGGIPSEVDAFARSHVAAWNGSVLLKGGGMRGKEGRGGGVDHRYSADISRKNHVEKWKETWQYLRYEGMRQVWKRHPSCVALQGLSKCASRWPEIEFNITFMAEAYKKRFGTTMTAEDFKTIAGDFKTILSDSE